MDESSNCGLLFHRLNNQLGIILANAELLEAKLADDMSRARAAQVVASVLDAMATAQRNSPPQPLAAVLRRIALTLTVLDPPVTPSPSNR